MLGFLEHDAQIKVAVSFPVVSTWPLYLHVAVASNGRGSILL